MSLMIRISLFDRLFMCALKPLACVLLIGMSFYSHPAEKNVETLDEVTIIGNTELPKVMFDEPWQLSKVDKGSSKSPPKDIPGVIESIEPHRYRQQIHFSHFLELDVESFQRR